MAAFNKYHTFAQDVGRKLHNLDADSFAWVLSNTAPDQATDRVLADVAEIAAGGGYLSGGVPISGTDFTQTGGVGKFIGDDETLTASGAVAAFRYIILYNVTANLVIGWYDRGSSLTLASGESFTFDADGTNGIFTLG